MDPRLEETWLDLLELIEDGRVVPVVGAELLKVEIDGESVGLYEYLADALARRLRVAGVEPGASLNQVVGRYLESGGELQRVYPQLRRSMPAEDSIEIPTALRKLAEIEPFKLFVTTTFDSLLERAINEVRFRGADKTETLAFTPADPQDLSRQWRSLGGATVYHLLGKLSAVPEYVVSDEDLLEFLHALQSENRRPERLSDELTRNSVLLIGCSFAGWLGRFFIRIAKGERLSRSGGSLDVVADSAASGDEELILFLDHYSSGTKILEGTPEEFVDELHRRWMEGAAGRGETASVPPSVNSEHEGSVFLSYASEDRDYAIALRDTLEDAGMEVWFDRDELQAGDLWERSIRSGLSRCALFVPLISKHTRTVQPRFFREEWVLAEEVWQRMPPNRRFVMPLVIDDTPSNAAEIPELFRQAQWARMEERTVPWEFVQRVRDLYRDYQLVLKRAEAR